MDAKIIIIGTEILKGEVQDVNASFLTRELLALGFETQSILCVPDREQAILEALQNAWGTAELVILTGGLGPTFDDKTRQTAAHFFNVPLEFRSQVFRNIQAYFKKRRRRMPSVARRQATFPRGCSILHNRFGVAPGFAIQKESKILVALPGVPRELQGMFRTQVAPFLKKKSPANEWREQLTFKVIGLQETEVLRRLGPRFPPNDPEIDCGIYPNVGEVTLVVRLRGPRKNLLRKKTASLKSIIQKKLRGYVYGTKAETIEAVLGKILRKERKTIAIAESLTGGLVSKRITDIPGASDYFSGAIVAYRDSAKKKLLHIEGDLLKRHQAVSAPVAMRMAENARKILGSDLAVALTGIAGPRKAKGGHPIGRVFVALAEKGGRTRVKKLHFLGDRAKIRLAASQAAFGMLREFLTGLPKKHRK